MRTKPPTRCRSTREAKPSLDILVLECDHAKLAADGLAVGDAAEISAKATHWLWGKSRQRSKGFTVEILRTDREEDLRGGLANIMDERCGARSVLVIAHSNERGVRLARDCFVSWRVAGRYLAPLRPTHVALLACRAGGRAAVSELVPEIPTVREVVASPATATWPLVIYLAGWLAARVRRRRISPDTKFLAQAGHALLGGNVVFHRTPRELRETLLVDILRDALHEEAAKFLAGIRRGRRPR